MITATWSCWFHLTLLCVFSSTLSLCISMTVQSIQTLVNDPADSSGGGWHPHRHSEDLYTVCVLARVDNTERCERGSITVSCSQWLFWKAGFSRFCFYTRVTDTKGRSVFVHESLALINSTLCAAKHPGPADVEQWANGAVHVKDYNEGTLNTFLLQMCSCTDF